MSYQIIPDEKDVRTVLEAHGLLPVGMMFDEAMKVVSLYSDRIQQILSELPESADKHKALLAILEEGLMQEGFIPGSHERKFEAPIRKTG